MSTIHLLVLIHGMWGNPTHLEELNRIVCERKREANADGVKLKVLLAETNRDDSTYDGIDWGGERVAQEVIDEVDKLASSGSIVTHLSVTGYSLGGLLARYVIGVLHQRDFFQKVKPVNFNTMATPHIGLPRYDSFFSSLATSLGPKLLSRTGEQFYCVDKWSATGRPLLEVMADPDRIFYQALSLFPNTTIYANAINDVTVPYVTSAIELEDPFAEHATNGIEIEFIEQYKPVLKSYTLPPFPPPPTPKPLILSPSWFRSLKPEKPILPPFLQFRFPLNLVLYMVLPLLIPSAVCFALIRLTVASRSSRARIKLLEKEQSNGQRLIDILAQLEKDVEDAVVDLVDETNLESDAALTDSNGELAPWKGKRKATSRPQQPILTPEQRKIVASLNKLPNLKKELVFIPAVRNAHAMIVCRDLKRFPVHVAGRGVIEHWADHFIL